MPDLAPKSAKVRLEDGKQAIGELGWRGDRIFFVGVFLILILALKGRIGKLLKWRKGWGEVSEGSHLA
jgi:hypothetical protein